MREGRAYTHEQAVKQNTRIQIKSKALPSFPNAEMIVPEHKNEGVGEIFKDNYRIIYSAKNDFIEILRIINFSPKLK